MEFILLAISFAVILAGALFFTNAIEWAGHKLDIGEGAIGSLLAAVGTAMPETLIPIVAMIGGAEGAEDVAIGAIIGAPFLLATIAMAIVGISALVYRGRRAAGHEAERARRDARPRPRLLPDLLRRRRSLIGLVVPDPLHIPLRSSSCSPTCVYVRRTLRGGGDVQEVETIEPLFMDSHPGRRSARRHRHPSAAGRPRRDRRRRPPLRRGADPRRRGRSASSRSSSR